LSSNWVSSTEAEAERYDTLPPYPFELFHDLYIDGFNSLNFDEIEIEGVCETMPISERHSFRLHFRHMMIFAPFLRHPFPAVVLSGKQRAIRAILLPIYKTTI
jgi:hypothetical protein